MTNQDVVISKEGINTKRAKVLLGNAIAITIAGKVYDITEAKLNGVVYPAEHDTVILTVEIPVGTLVENSQGVEEPITSVATTLIEYIG